MHNRSRLRCFKVPIVHSPTIIGIHTVSNYSRHSHSWFTKMAFLKRLNPHFRSKSSASGDGSSLTPVAEMAPPSDLPLTSDSAEEYATDDPDQ